MNETSVVHVNDKIDSVYIGRRMNRRGLPESPFANPFPLESAPTRAALLDKYRGYLAANPRLYRLLPELRGKAIACWCRHDGEARTEANACHGDVLVALLDAYTDDELRAMAAPGEPARAEERSR